MDRNSLTQTVLEVRDITKRFGAVEALRGVSFKVSKGEVLGLLGDNGAGKSTLVKCISGIHRPDSGEILIGGEAVQLESPMRARQSGIETVFQDLAIVPEFDVVQNLYLNRELQSKNPLLRWLGWLDTKAMARQSQKSLNRLNSRIPSLEEKIINLSGGQRQAVAIARAISWGAEIVIMDEPTAALGVEQSAQVNDLIRLISSQGVAVVLISHNMQNVLETCDRAIVLFQGRCSADVPISEVDKSQLVALITGAAENELAAAE